MEKEIRITTTYKNDDVAVVIEKGSISTMVHIFRESATGRTESLSLTQTEALQLVAILHTANEEAEI